MHLFALRSPVVTLAMELLHHPPTFVPHSLHRLFQGLAHFGCHLLVIRPEICEHALRMLLQLRPNRS
jgi:hypothetical protein